jgi:zinc transport system ATP-binding protein
MSTQTAISLEDVWVRYDGQPVLEGIHLDVTEGEIVSIVGPNGSGKTTLLNTILGFIQPFQGRVQIFGQNPEVVRHSGLIGYLPQNPETDLRFPIRAEDVVAMTRWSRRSVFHRLSNDDHVKIHAALARVHMDGVANQHFGSLSGGQKQRVLIARALALDPKILILDEPSTGLDAVAQDSFYSLLLSLRDEQGLTILLVSHDIGAVSGIVDRIACLNRRIHFHGNPADCIPSDALVKVFGQDVQFVYHDRHCHTCGEGE